MAEQRRFSGVLLVDQRGWLLLQERDEHPLIDPECWGLVGGHVDPGEGFESAAYRELTDGDVVCREGRRIVFVDPGEVTGLRLTKGAGVILPAFLLSDVYKTLVA